MAIYKVSEGGEPPTYVISSGGAWLPGSYEDRRTANYAFRFPDDVLLRLRDQAKTRAGRQRGVITWGDLEAAKRSMKA